MPFSQKPTISEHTQLTPYWRLLISLLIQLGSIITLLAPTTYRQLTGKTVILQTAPIDPYDVLRGRYVTLEYNISRVEALKNLPGWNDMIKQYPGSQYYPVPQGTTIYIVMRNEGVTTRPWKPLRVTSTLPTTLPENQVALRGVYQYGSIVYGLEKFYMPEVKVDFANQDIFDSSQIRVGQQQPIIMQIKVDSQGNAAPVQMQVVDTVKGKKIRSYEF
jgi:uncharacterized membrane-anchored protein